ncbi:hypothetical protein [Pendulispora albinea]|uniref:Uncharacterized protein n=1 Tax=Pendulispora albinea TaxID=2741071 RepID=A0ABZ2LKG8_9BACT
MEMRWAHAAFGAIFPSGSSERLPLGICDLDLESYLAETRSRVPFRSALGLRLAIWLVALAPLFVLHRFATIASLDESSRATVIRNLLTSPIYVVRQLVMLLKAVGAVLYAGAPAVREAILAATPRTIPEVNQSGTRLIGVGRKPAAAGGEHDEHDEHEEPHEGEEAHDEQSVA